MPDEVESQLIALIPRLRRFALTLTRGIDSDDLVQAALERALGRLHQWQPGTRLDSWMFRIMQTIWIDQHRRGKAAGRQVPAEAAEDLAGADGRAVTLDRLLLAEVRREVAALPDELRAVVGLVIVDGLSYKEAAASLEVPIGTVMSRLSRARARLARLLDDETAAFEDDIGRGAVS